MIYNNVYDDVTRARSSFVKNFFPAAQHTVYLKNRLHDLVCNIKLNRGNRSSRGEKIPFASMLVKEETNETYQ